MQDYLQENLLIITYFGYKFNRKYKQKHDLVTLKISNLLKILVYYAKIFVGEYL